MWDDVLGPPTAGTVGYHVIDDVAIVALQRPERLNALTPELYEDLEDSLRRAQRSHVRTVILCGRGRSFCAGLDLKEDLEPPPMPELRTRLARPQRIVSLMRGMDAPIIAAVHGYALGGGCELALGADMIVAAQGATFGFPEVEVGLSVTGGISHLLPRTIGLALAKELVLLGERFSAQRAHDLGLVNRVVADDLVVAEARQIATRLVERSATALALAKAALNQGDEASLSTTLQLEIDHGSVAKYTDEARHAARAFRERP